MNYSQWPRRNVHPRDSITGIEQFTYAEKVELGIKPKGCKEQSWIIGGIAVIVAGILTIISMFIN